MRPLRRVRATRRHGVRRRVVPLLLSGLLLLTPPPLTLAQHAPASTLLLQQAYGTSIAEASRRFRIPEDWIRAVLAAESEHDPRAVSDAGAMGLMQVMPATWDELSARLELGDDPFEPHANILAGTAYLREMLDHYGDVTSMLAAYNAGPGRYDEYLAAVRPLSAETIDYVAKLAPVLGGEALPSGVETTAESADWREAPLFVLSAGSAPAAGAWQPDSHAGATPLPHDDPSASASAGIFIARSNGRSWP